MKKLSVVVYLAILAGLLLGLVLPSANVKVVSAQSAQLLLFWDDKSHDSIPPSGWTCISDKIGDPFFEKYPRGAPTYGGEGGSPTHTHTLTVLSCDPPSATMLCQSGSGFTSVAVASPTHTHTSASIPDLLNILKNIPLSKGLRVIQCDGGIPTTIPAGAIALFNSEPPAGWTRYSSQDGYFIVGSIRILTGIEVGSNTHSHIVNTGDPTDTVTAKLKLYQGTPVASGFHGHGGISDEESDEPPYIEIILAKADSDTTIPTNMIGMFNNNPGQGWTVISDVGGDLYHHFLKGSESYGATGGSETHSHGNLTITASPHVPALVNITSATIEVASEDHTHDNLVVSFSTESNIPPYRDVIFAKPVQYVDTATGKGVASFSTVNGSINGLTASNSSPCGTLPGVIFPYGLFSFTITGIAPGSTVTVTIVLPGDMPQGAQYWKCLNGQWINATSILGDNDGDEILTLALTDGSQFDGDGLANGIIVDPGGPAQVVETPKPPPPPPLARQLKPSYLTVQYLNVSPKQASAGQPVTIMTNVVNGGDQAGNYNVALRINGRVEQTKMVSVGPKASQPIKFIVNTSEPGTYTVDILDQNGSFTVAGTGSSTGKPVNSGIIILIALVGLVLVVAVILVMRFQRSA